MPGKVLARSLHVRVRQKLLTHQRHEQSVFTPKKSSVDRILAVRVLTERLRDFQIWLLAAYANLRKAFDSVNLDVLGRILTLRGIPPKLANLIVRMYMIVCMYMIVRTESVASCDGTISNYFSS